MKKISYYLVAIILLGGFVVSCSNDDAEDFGSGASPEARMAEIKQQFLFYGLQYGIEDMQFDDEGLRKHLNITKDDIEREVLNMAIALGKVEKKVGKIRRKARKKEATRDEEFGSYTFTHVSGTFDESKDVDSLRIKYSISFYRSNLVRKLEPIQASVEKLRKCDNPQCQIWHKTDTCSYANLHYPTGSMFIGDFGGAPGEEISFVIKYNVTVSLSDVYFHFLIDFNYQEESVTTRIENGL